MRNYIGLATSFHDPALSIVNSRGEVVFAEATERYLQTKRALGVTPDQYFQIRELIDQYCEKDAEIVVAFSWQPFGRERLLYRLLSGIMMANKIARKRFGLLIGEIAYGINEHVAGRFVEYSVLARQENVIRRHYDHHFVHAATACFTSPFDEAVCVVIDGAGQMGKSTGFFRYVDGKVSPIRSLKSSIASLGWFYGSLCEACGFDSMKGEEWKVMGLAAYGTLDPDLYRTLRRCIGVDGSRLVMGKDGQLAMNRLITRRSQYKDSPINAANLAHTGQRVYCDVASELLRNVYSQKISENLILSGGCSLNSAHNGLVLSETPFKNLHVYCAPADDGNAVGAALCAYHDDHPETPARRKLGSPYLGSSISKNALHRLREHSNFRLLSSDAAVLAQNVAELLAAGKIVGWMQGRAEFGPRALGNRSILADPRHSGVKERLNATVKFREEFRPFAPAILHEYGPEYFEHYQETPYMERALLFRKEVRNRVPGVVHVDGTGRLQSVKREWNPRYYELIEAFRKITGVPIVLNTSFNVMGKPIIHTVEDAVAVFQTSGLDILVIDDCVFEKRESAVDTETPSVRLRADLEPEPIS